MGCFGCKKSTFKRLDNDQCNNNNITEENNNNNNNNFERKFRSRSLRGLDNRKNFGTRSSREFRGVVQNDYSINDSNIASCSRNGNIRHEDQTQSNLATLKVRSRVTGKEKEEDPTNYLLSPMFKSKHKSRTSTDSPRERLNERKEEKNSLNDLLKDSRRKKGASRTGSDVTAKKIVDNSGVSKTGSDAKENEDNTGNDLSQKLKDDLLSQKLKDIDLKDDRGTNAKEARAFKYDDLAKATGNFRSSCFLGEGGFGKVYKGHLEEINQEVAIKQLDRMGSQGIREFVMEVLTLSLADHPNLVKLLGFCVDGDKRLLVYEYMPLGSLERYLNDLEPEQKPLDWSTRMKIAAGAARGLEYLHEKSKPPVIYRDLKCANILLGEGYHAKLSDFGLAKVGPSGNKTHVSTRVMGTYGYCAPDYAMTGQLNFKSDIYSFGVVLLELITGRKAFDHSKSGKDQSLVAWARPLFKDRKKFPQMADPLLEGKYPIRGLYQALAIAAMCIQEKPGMRPAIADVVNALNFLASQAYNSNTHGKKDSRSSSTSHSLDGKDPESIYLSIEEKSSDDDNHDSRRKTNGFSKERAGNT